MADYPGAIKSAYTQYKNKDIPAGELGDDVPAPDFNSHGNELVAIETELGTNPKGTKADVKTRLDDADTAIATIPVIKMYVLYQPDAVEQDGPDIDYIIGNLTNYQVGDLLQVRCEVSLNKRSAGVDPYRLKVQLWTGADWGPASDFHQIYLSASGQKGWIYIDEIGPIPEGFDGKIRISLNAVSGDWTYYQVALIPFLYRNVPIAGL